MTSYNEIQEEYREKNKERIQRQLHCGKTFYAHKWTCLFILLIGPNWCLSFPNWFFRYPNWCLSFPKLVIAGKEVGSEELDVMIESNDTAALTEGVSLLGLDSD